MIESREDRRIDREIHRTAGGSDPFAAAVRATRMPMLITDPRQDDNPIIFVNDAFGRLTGFTREETLGRNCRFLQGPATNAIDVGRIRASVEKRVPIEIEILNYRKDGTTFWNRVLISPVFEGDELTYFFASQFDITPERERISRLAADQDSLEAEIERRIADLRASEERLHFTLKAGRLGSWTLDLSEKRLLASAICKENFGRHPTDPFDYDELRSAIDEADRERWDRVVAHAIETGEDLDIEYRVRTPDGAPRWVEVRGQTTYRADGTPLGMAGVSLDITERKRAEEQRQLLTRELDHRVKNTLAMVQSIAVQTLRSADRLDEASGLLSQRIQALAVAHDLLTREGWAGAPLREVVDNVLHPFQNGGEQRFKVAGPRIMLRAQAATALSLALHELATNASKYGSLSGEEGEVCVEWTTENERFELIWREVDGPPVETPTNSGFGTRMIERALAADLDGEAEIDFRPDGVVFTFSAPIANLADGAALG